MYIRKSVLKKFVLVMSIVILLIVGILYCFTELAVPTVIYGAAWFGCLAVMLAGTSGMYR